MQNEHMELRSEVGSQVEQAKTRKHELKSQIYTKHGRARQVIVGPEQHGFVPNVTDV